MRIKYLQLDNEHFSQKLMYLLQKQNCNNDNHQQPALNKQMIINYLFIKCVHLHIFAVMVIDVMKDEIHVLALTDVRRLAFNS